MKKPEAAFRPDRIGSYFRMEWLPLAFITLSGLVYNLGLLAGPWFEGQLAQCLADILGGRRPGGAMTVLVLAYVGVTLTVQAARFIKRFYVRRFANDVNRRMKGVLYANLVRQSRRAQRRHARPRKKRRHLPRLRLRGCARSAMRTRCTPMKRRRCARTSGSRRCRRCTLCCPT